MITVEQIPDLLRQAYQVALDSPDPSTQNGALLVNSWNGQVLLSEYNRFPDGVKSTEERWKRPLKYSIVSHSEEGLICKAASKGLCTTGLTLVSPWMPCDFCAKAIIQAKIKTVISHRQATEKTHDAWKNQFEVSSMMLEEAGVEMVSYDGFLNFHREVRFHEKLWKP